MSDTVNVQAARRGRKARNAEVPAEGMAGNVLLTALVIGLPVVLLSLFFSMTYNGLTQPDAMDYAQIARNLLSGHGFTTYVLRPLALTHGADPFRQPDVTHGPLYPMLLAMAMGIAGARDATVVGVSATCFYLTVPLVYLLGARLFGRPAGIVAALAVSVSAEFLRAAVSGTAAPLEGLHFTAMLLALVTAVGRMDSEQPAPLPVRPLACAGLLAGALYLTDPMFCFMLPIIPIIAALAAPRDRGRAAASVLTPMLLIAIPWMIRLGSITGNPLLGLRGSELWMKTAAYPEFQAYRMLPANVVPGERMLLALFRKALTCVVVAVPIVTALGASPVLVFFVPGLLYRFSSQAANRARTAVVCTFFALLVAGMLFGADVMPVSVLLPALIVFGTAFMLHLAQSAGQMRALAGTALAVIAVLPAVGALALTPKAESLPAAATARRLERLAGLHDVSISDQPWITAWYSGRPSIWAPHTDSDTLDLSRRFPNVHWLLLTDMTQRLDPSWRQVYVQFARWNSAYEAAIQQKATPPQPVTVTGSGSSLLDALHGFSIVPPADAADAGVVLAGIPSQERPSTLPH